MHSSEVTGTVQSTPFSTFFRLRLSLSRAALRRAQSMRDAQRAQPAGEDSLRHPHWEQRPRAAAPIESAISKNEQGRPILSTRLERRAPGWKGEHHAGKASTTMLWACLPPRRRHGSPLVCDPRPIAAPYCCAQPPLPGLMHTSSVMSLFSTKYLGPRFVITEYTSPLGS